MGVRGELFSTKVSLQNRTYFFNVKENRLGDLYLNIVESKNREEGGFERQSVILFAEDLQEFLRGFDESLKVLEKAVREKRRGRSDSTQAGKDRGERKPSEYRGERPSQDSRRGGGESKDEGKRRFKPRGGHDKSGSPGRTRPAANRETQGKNPQQDKPPRKRVVVKKS